MTSIEHDPNRQDGELGDFEPPGISDNNSPEDLLAEYATRSELSKELKIGERSVAWSWGAVVDRCALRLSNALAASADRGDWFGRMRLYATKRARADESFSLAEKRMLSNLLQPTKPSNGAME